MNVDLSTNETESYLKCFDTKTGILLTLVIITSSTKGTKPTKRVMDNCNSCTMPKLFEMSNFKPTRCI